MDLNMLNRAENAMLLLLADSLIKHARGEQCVGLCEWLMSEIIVRESDTFSSQLTLPSHAQQSLTGAVNRTGIINQSASHAVSVTHAWCAALTATFINITFTSLLHCDEAASAKENGSCWSLQRVSVDVEHCIPITVGLKLQSGCKYLSWNKNAGVE